jgi:hypothetical protein
MNHFSDFSIVFANSLRYLLIACVILTELDSMMTSKRKTNSLRSFELTNEQVVMTNVATIPHDYDSVFSIKRAVYEASMIEQHWPSSSTFFSNVLFERSLAEYSVKGIRRRISSRFVVRGCVSFHFLKHFIDQDERK